MSQIAQFYGHLMRILFAKQTPKIIDVLYVFTFTFL